MDSRAELEAKFGRLSDDVAIEAGSVLRLYGLSVSDLYFKWEAFVFASSSGSSSKNEGLDFNLDNLRELKKEIQSAAQHQANIKKENNVGSTPSLNSRVRKLGGRAALDGILDGMPATPLAKKGRPLGSTNTPASATPIARSGTTTTTTTGGAFSRSAAGPSYTPAGKSSLAANSNNVHASSQIRSPGLNGTASLVDSPSSGANSGAARFEDRKNALEIVESLNSHLSAIVGSATESSSSRIALASNADPRKYSYRYMFEKITERADVLNSTIDECAEQIKEYYSIEELGNPCYDSQEDMYCVGRICPESDGVKLTETSIQFETSRRYGGGGDRCSLRFDPEMCVRSTSDPTGAGSINEGGVGLFPGMIVGVKGRNAGAGYFTVSEVLLMPPVDQPESPLNELVDFQHGKAKLDGEPLSVIAACGPYTVDENLDYAPLAALLEEAANLKPDALILLGPFVDSSHPLIKVGDVDETPQQIFQRGVASRINSFLDWAGNANVILIPSPRDLISHHVAYPQAPLEKEGLGLHKRAKLLPNPATFQINEIVFATTSIDTLFSLKSQEYFKKAKDAADATLGSDALMSSQEASRSDAMARVCRHVLRQRSFYPLFPSPQQAPLDPLNLDVTHSDLLKFNEGTGADVFIMPSMLKHFAKIVDSAVVINPSTLAKKNQAGTFTKLTIYPTSKVELQRSAQEMMETDGDEDDVTLDHRVWERCRVDIVRV